MDIFLIQNNNLLEKHNTVWDKVSASIKIYCAANLSTKNNF